MLLELYIRVVLSALATSGNQTENRRWLVALRYM